MYGPTEQQRNCITTSHTFHKGCKERLSQNRNSYNNYHTYSIMMGFSLSRTTTNNLISPMKFCYNTSIIPVLPLLNNPKDLDPSYKMDLDFWECFGRKKTLSYSRRDTVMYFSAHMAHKQEIFCTNYQSMASFGMNTGIYITT